MRLPLDQGGTTELFRLLDQFDRLGFRSVLVGGLVPPLLLEAIDPQGFDSAHRPRRTADCDLALDLAVAEGDRRNDQAETLLADLGWRRDARANEFRWEHACGLRLDLLPVPAGIEAQHPAAIAFARSKLPEVKDLARFYRGYELALQEAIEVEIDADGIPGRSLRIAGVTAFLAMKLEAWMDSAKVRTRDAHDIAWLVRYADAAIVVDALRRSSTRRPDLVEEIVARLANDFADPWHYGVLHYAGEAFGMRSDDQTEPDRNAAARSIQRVLAGFAVT